MDEIDEEVGEEEEEGELEVVVQWEGCVGWCVVKLAVASDLCCETYHRQDCHTRHGGHGLFDLQLYLIFEIFWMLECGFVKDEDVGQRRENEVQKHSKDPRYEEQA